METTNNFIQIIPKDSLGKVMEFRKSDGISP